jgi:RraA family protein
MNEMSNVGFRIYTKIHRPSPELVESFKGLPVANIADEMNRFFCVDARVKPMNKVALLGPAFTVRARTADNLLLHKAIAMAQPGDVIVVDVQGDLVNSITGEIMMREACKKGLGGVVIDGAVRDSEALRELNMAVYAAGVTPKGPYKDGPGEINVPISCGGVVVNPGDIVVGDADGIVVISPQDAPDLLVKAKAKFEKEQEIFRAIEAGTRDKSWIERELKARGCEVIEGYYRKDN